MTAVDGWGRLRCLRTFSLRTGLLLFLACGIALGLFSRWYHHVRQRGEAQLRLAQWRNSRQRGAPLFHAQYSTRDRPTWFTSQIRKWVHPEYDRRFEMLRFFGDSMDSAIARDAKSSFGVEIMDLSCDAISPQDAETLLSASGLKELSITSHSGGSGWSDEALLNLKIAKSLKSLHARSPFLSDQTCRVVSELPSLIELHVEACTPEGIAILANSKTLQKLNITSLRHGESDFRGPHETEGRFRERSRLAMKQALKSLQQNQGFSYLSIDGPLGLTPEDLTEFCQTSKLKTLHLRSPEIAPECLAEFAKLANLESFTCYDLNIRDDHLKPLAKAKKLKFLCIGPNLSGDAIVALREQMPDCKIGMY